MQKRYQRSILSLIAVLFVAALTLYVMRVPLAKTLMERQLTQNMSGGPAFDRLEDGLHLVLCGAGAPLPDAKRSGPCVGVAAGKSFFVIDAGTNGARNLVRMNWPPGRIDALFLTHFHSDHIDGLGEMALLRWAQGGHKTPLPVYGADGVQKIVAGFNRAYQLDVGYRVAHHGKETMAASGAGMKASTFKQPKMGEELILWDKDGIKISTFSVAHAPVDPAVGYKFEYKDRVIIISGDTKKSPNLEAMAKGADLLAHEALSPTLVGIITRAAEKSGNQRVEKITKDILDYHTAPVEIAQIAAAANVRHVLLYHIVPPLPIAPLEKAFMDGMNEFWQGDITLGRDGTMISLPAKSEEIIVRELLF